MTPNGVLAAYEERRRLGASLSEVELRWLLADEQGRTRPPTRSSLLVTQVRSGIGTKPKHRGTLRALGLGRIGKSNLLPDRPEIRGMIARVPHLITVSEEQTV